MDYPKITFGMIVLNGEPFVKYNLRSLYPYAHQIIVIEGASLAAGCISTFEGHSRDSTLQSLREFKAYEDPENKLIIVTAEDEGYTNGFWPGEKLEQSQTYAKRATGDYLWQVDVDEFYKTEDIEWVIDFLIHNQKTTQISFKQITFWGGFNYITDGIYLRRRPFMCQRIFKWEKGYSYTSHRPPTICDFKGNNLRNISYLSGKKLAALGIYMYHYSLVFPNQVTDKCEYYQNVQWTRRGKAMEWAKNSYFGLTKPFRVHNAYDHFSWLEMFNGSHPDQINLLNDDIQSNSIKIDMRPYNDIENLLRSSRYKVIRSALKVLSIIDMMLFRFRYLIRFTKTALKMGEIHK